MLVLFFFLQLIYSQDVENSIVIKNMNMWVFNINT